MFTKFFVMLATAVLLVVGMPHVGRAQIDCRVQTSNPACIKHQQAPGTPVPHPDLICFNIQQTRAGIVTLNIYDASGVQINASDVHHSEVKNAADTFCIGRHWMQKGYLFEWCTDDASRVWSHQAILDYARGGAPTVMLVPSPNNRPHRPTDLPQVQRIR